MKIVTIHGTVGEIKNSIAEIWSAKRVGEPSETHIVRQYSTGEYWLGLGFDGTNVYTAAKGDSSQEVLSKLVNQYEEKHDLKVTQQW